MLGVRERLFVSEVGKRAGVEFHGVSVLSPVQLFVTPRILALQAPLSMGFPRQEYWSVLPRPPPGDLPDPVIKPGSPALQANSLLSEPF